MTFCTSCNVNAKNTNSRHLKIEYNFFICSQLPGSMFPLGVNISLYTCKLVGIRYRGGKQRPFNIK